MSTDEDLDPRDRVRALVERSVQRASERGVPPLEQLVAHERAGIGRLGSTSADVRPRRTAWLATAAAVLLVLAATVAMVERRDGATEHASSASRAGAGSPILDERFADAGVPFALPVERPPGTTGVTVATVDGGSLTIVRHQQYSVLVCAATACPGWMAAVPVREVHVDGTEFSVRVAPAPSRASHPDDRPVLTDDFRTFWSTVRFTTARPLWLTDDDLDGPGGPHGVTPSGDAVDEALRREVERYNTAIYGGDASTAFELTSRQCRADLPGPEALQPMLDQAVVMGASASDGKLRWFFAEIDGTTAAVSYSLPGAEVEREFWTYEDGAWRHDDRYC